MMVLDDEFIILFANNALLKVAGVRESDVIGHSVFDAFPANPSDNTGTGRDELKLSLERMSKTLVVDEMPLVKYDVPVRGSLTGEFEERFWKAVNTPVLNSEGKLTHILHRTEDVTDKVNAQKMIDDSENRFRRIADSSPVILWTAAADGTVDWFSKRWYEFTGYPRDTWDASDSPIPPEDVPGIWEQWSACVENGTLYKREIRIRSSQDGEYKWFISRAEPVRDSSGKIFKWIGSVSIIHEQKLSALKLENEKLKLEAAISQSPSGIALMRGPEFIFEKVNTKFTELVGPRDYLGKAWRDVYLEIPDSPLPGIMTRVLNSGEPYVAAEQPISVLVEGNHIEERYYDIDYRRILDSNGNAYGIFCQTSNVTQRVNDRRSLIESAKDLSNERRKLADIIKESQTGIALVRGSSLIFEVVNKKFTELVSPREYIGRTWEEIYHELPNSEFPNLMREVLETGKPLFVKEMEIPVEVLPGVIEKRFYDFSYVRALDRDGSPYGIYFQCSNVTHYVSLRNEMHESSKVLATTIDMLKSERDLRERFVAALSHDLRTPLTVAKMSSELIARKLLDNPAMLKAAHRITDNMNRADGMIRDILDASSINAGEKVPLKIQKGEVSEILNEVIEDLQGIYGDRFQMNIEAGIEGYWDLDGLKRIIENLLSNGIKYGAIGSKVTVTAKSSSKTVLLSVHNKGFPIPENELSTLFDQFKRSQTAQSGGQKGWGLGLTLVKGITESHGGKVSVESNSDQGTTFFVELPRDTRYVQF